MTNPRSFLEEMRVLDNGRISRYGTVGVLSKSALEPPPDTTRVVVHHDDLRHYTSRSYRAKVGVQGITIVNRRGQSLATIDLQSFDDLRVQSIGTVLRGGFVISQEHERSLYGASLEQVAKGIAPDQVTDHSFVRVLSPGMVGRRVVIINLGRHSHIIYTLRGKQVPHTVEYPLQPEKWGRHIPVPMTPSILKTILDYS